MQRKISKCLQLRAFDPHSNLETFLITDASISGLSGYLAQGSPGSNWSESWPVLCWSRKYKPSEMNYHTTEQEKLAVVCALQQFEHLLRGMEFTICTDHCALVGQ